MLPLAIPGFAVVANAIDASFSAAITAIHRTRAFFLLHRYSSLSQTSGNVTKAPISPIVSTTQSIALGSNNKQHRAAPTTPPAKQVQTVCFKLTASLRSVWARQNGDCGGQDAEGHELSRSHSTTPFRGFSGFGALSGFGQPGHLRGSAANARLPSGALAAFWSDGGITLGSGATKYSSET